jgi:hypothetical protein
LLQRLKKLQALQGYKAKSPNKISPLALFMARVFADHVHHVLALHDLATGTKSFY